MFTVVLAMVGDARPLRTARRHRRRLLLLRPDAAVLRGDVPLRSWGARLRPLRRLGEHRTGSPLLHARRHLLSLALRYHQVRLSVYVYNTLRSFW